MIKKTIILLSCIVQLAACVRYNDDTEKVSAKCKDLELCALNLENNNCFDSAFISYKHASDMSLKDGSLSNFLRLQIKLAHVCLLAGNAGKAIEIIKINEKKIIKQFGYKHCETATMQNLKAVSLFETGKYDEAMLYALNAYASRKSNNSCNHDDLADSYNTLGSVYISAGNSSMAGYYFNKAIGLYTSGQINKNQTRINILNNAGNYFRSCDSSDKAILFHKTALSILTSSSKKDYYQFISVMNNLGNDFLIIGQLDSALQCYQSSLSILLKRGIKNESELSGTLNNIGNIYLNLGEYDKSREYYNKSLIFSALNNDRLNTSISYLNIGSAYLSEGKYEYASEYLNKALVIRSNLYNSNHIKILEVNKQIGQLYLAYNKPLEAIDLFRSILGKSDSLTYESKSSRAEINYLLGISCTNINNQELALRYFIKAFHLIEKDGIKNTLLRAVIYQAIGKTYENAGKPELAIDFYEKSLQTIELKYGSKSSRTASALNTIADFFLLNSRFEKAIDFYDKAFSANCLGDARNSLTDEPLKSSGNQFAFEFYNDYTAIESLFGKALALEYREENKFQNITSVAHIKSAFYLYVLADKIIKKALNSSLSQHEQLMLVEKSEMIYEKALGICYKLFTFTSNDNTINNAIIQFIDASKSNVLYRTLLASNALYTSKIPESILKKEKALLYEKRVLEESNIRSRINNLSNYREYTEKLFDINRKYEQLVENIEKNYPSYHLLKYKTPAPLVNEIKDLLSDSSAAISYFTGKKSLYIFVVTKRNIGFYQIGIDLEFEELVKSYYLDICNYRFNEYPVRSYALYEKLIRPAEKFFENGIQHLILIPHDYLLYIPFETLIQSENKKSHDFKNLSYLINRFDISYQFSFSLWNFSSKKIKGKQKQPATFLGIAPGFMKSDFGGTITVDSLNLNELPQSVNEIRSLKRLFEHANLGSKILAGNDATKDNLIKTQKDFSIIHMATHGYSYDFAPELTFLAFAPVKKTKAIMNIFQKNNSSGENNWIMRSGEMYNMTLNADLLVLSACESGYGNLHRGEGIMSMTRGFIYSGASNVVYTLWSVEDKTTCDLMIRFYENILNGNSYSRALRQAKIELINNPATAFPRSWAGYFLLGE
jgi:CHAT domain-containing protein